MKMACQRHLTDIINGHKRGLFWSAQKAEDAKEFFPTVLTVTAGARAGHPFHLPSYVGFVVGCLFGWYRDSGLLRFREAWLELGKGMVKTPLSAAIGLYTMGWRNIPRSEVYAIAKDRNQANVLFSDAVNLCRAPIPNMGNNSLETTGEVLIRGTGEMSWMIEHPATHSKFRALANDERISGPKPTMVAADEIHEWPSIAQIELWKAAMVKMPTDALLMLTTNTPAADQVMATELSEFYQGLLKGTFEDDSVFALIARVDEKDNPMEDETCWKKALPLLDITYPAENVRNAVKSAKHRISTTLATKRLYFGIPVGASEYWIDLDAWEAVQGEVDADNFKGQPCTLALDLSQKNDLTAVTAVWVFEGKRYVKVWYWRPDHNVQDASKADMAQYVEWSLGGYLNLVPGRSIEYEFVAAKIQQLCSEHKVAALAFDPAHISEFRKACDRIGFETWIWKQDEPPGEGLKMIIHAQGRMGMHSKQMLWMPRSLQQTEDAILRGDVVIDANPITNWCSSNAAIEADAQNNRWLVKKRLRGRIDGVVSMAMGMGISLAGLEEAREKTYQMLVL
jgi:phage terminase large subunit-like protein